MIASVGANGEPFVDFSRTASSGDFSHFYRSVTGEWLHQQRQPTSEEQEEMRKWHRQLLQTPDIRINVSNRVFQFVPTECCSDVGGRWGHHDRKFTVPVLKKRNGHTYWDRKYIRTCQCARCKGTEAFGTTRQFLHEVNRVRIEV
jgi:hypothetical protein